MRRATTLVVVVLMLGACQTRRQATMSTVAAVSVGLVGGYFEYRGNGADDSLPPVTVIGSGVIAVLSAASIFLLNDKPRRFFESPGPTDDWKPRRRNGTDLLVAIHRTRCYGGCSVYSVTIYRDGTVEYNGEEEVLTKGRATGRISGERLRVLEARFASFTSLSRRYVDGRCTHQPVIYTWYQPLHGSRKSVAHKLGDPAAPRLLNELEDAVDDAADVEQWTGRRRLGPISTYCR